MAEPTATSPEVDELTRAKRGVLECCEAMSPVNAASHPLRDAAAHRPWTALGTALGAGLIVGGTPMLRRALRRGVFHLFKVARFMRWHD